VVLGLRQAAVKRLNPAGIPGRASRDRGSGTILTRKISSQTPVRVEIRPDPVILDRYRELACALVFEAFRDLRRDRRPPIRADAAEFFRTEWWSGPWLESLNLDHGAVVEALQRRGLLPASD
jgi:hypothetical protein